jgi:CHRD domain/PEP-CTERM motif
MRRILGSLSLLLAFVFYIGAPAPAAVFNYTTFLSGPNEFPVNNSPGTGTGTFVYDNVAHTFSHNVTFQNLQGPTQAAHIHAPTTAPFFQTANVATTTPSFAGFPLGVQSGNFMSTLDLTLASSWNPSYVTANGGTTAGAEAAFITAIRERKAYFNIHTSPPNGIAAGEIRGFLIPEPGTMALIVLAAVGAIIARRRRA